jgi:hypothetical protein
MMGPSYWGLNLRSSDDGPPAKPLDKSSTTLAAAAKFNI